MKTGPGCQRRLRGSGFNGVRGFGVHPSGLDVRVHPALAFTVMLYTGGDVAMIQRFYVHNYRCMENFELPIAGKPSSLLIGKNGTGKSTIGFVLEILQRIARGTNRVSQLVKPSDFCATDPMSHCASKSRLSSTTRCFGTNSLSNCQPGSGNCGLQKKGSPATVRTSILEIGQKSVSREAPGTEKRTSSWTGISLPCRSSRSNRSPILSTCSSVGLARC